jgi:hypothetical protein
MDSGESPVAPNVIRAGDTSKANPFTICIVANPALEAPWQTGQFYADPIVLNSATFNNAVAYILTVSIISVD